MSKPTPEDIMRRAYIEAENNGEPLIYRIGAQVKALTDAGKVIVDREALKNLLRAQVRSDKLTDQIIDELTKDTGS